MNVKEIQLALIARGYAPGDPDGYIGPLTIKAIEAFQRDSGLLVDGDLGPKTLAALAPELREVGTTGLLSADLILKVCPKAREDIVSGILERRAAVEAAGIMTKMRLAHFLSQIATESLGLTQLEENLNYKTAQRLMEVWPTRFRNLSAGRPYVNNPQALARLVYGGRLGNDRANDPWDFRGGGLIMTTGEYNYTEAGYVDRPDDLRKMPGAIDAALTFWMKNGLNALADRGAVAPVRKRVQGGTGGLSDAETYFKRAAKALKV